MLTVNVEKLLEKKKIRENSFSVEQWATLIQKIEIRFEWGIRNLSASIARYFIRIKVKKGFRMASHCYSIFEHWLGPVSTHCKHFKCYNRSKRAVENISVQNILHFGHVSFSCRYIEMYKNRRLCKWSANGNALTVQHGRATLFHRVLWRLPPFSSQRCTFFDTAQWTATTWS